MDQILVSVCCPPQNEHIDIKNVANSHVGVTLKRRQKRPKIHDRNMFLAANFPSLQPGGSQKHISLITDSF